jgi:hypothetical protein
VLPVPVVGIDLKISLCAVPSSNFLALYDARCDAITFCHLCVCVCVVSFETPATVSVSCVTLCHSMSVSNYVALFILSYYMHFCVDVQLCVWVCGGCVMCGGCVAVQLCSVLTIKNRLSMSLPTLSLGCVRMSSLDDGDGLHYLSSVLCVNRAIVLNHFCLSCDKLDVQRVASKPRSKHLPHDMQHYQ